MTKLQALTAYLLKRQLVPSEQLDSWVEKMDVDHVWKLTDQGLHMGDNRYTAVLSFERFNGAPERLVALVGTWLAANDPDRERYDLAQPAYDIEPLDLGIGLFNVDLALEFAEPLYLAEDADGEFEAFGKTWAFVPYDLWIAEHGEVTARG